MDYLTGLYDIGVGMVIIGTLLLIIFLIVYFLDTFTRSWLQWVFLGLAVLIIIGIGLLCLYYSYTNAAIAAGGIAPMMVY